MGGKPSTKGADEANKLAAQEAAYARQKEVDRQKRLDTGYGNIRSIFEGAPVYEKKNQAFDWKGFKPTGADGKPSGVPAGYEALQVADPNYKAPRGGGADGRPVSQRVPANVSRDGLLPWAGNPDMKGDPYVTINRPTAGTAAAGPSKVWALKGPDGKIHYTGDTFNYDANVDTGARTGGFGDDFYGGISKNVTDLGNVDIEDQYGKARENLQYALARQGLSSSSAANQGVADLEGAKGKAQGDLNLQAQDASTKVRQQVDQEKQAAISQLYATEDPSLTADTALSKSATILADKPNYNSLGDIFGSVLQGFGNVLGAGRSQGYFGGSGSPTVRPAGG